MFSSFYKFKDLEGATILELRQLEKKLHKENFKIDKS